MKGGERSTGEFLYEGEDLLLGLLMRTMDAELRN